MKTESTTRNFQINGKQYSYLLLKRRGQKHIRLKIGSDGGIVVSAPSTAGLKRIDKMIQDKKGWIQKQLEKYLSQAQIYDPLKQLPFFGEWYTVVHAEKTRKGTVRIDRADRKILIDSVFSEAIDLRNILQRRLKGEAKKIVPSLLDAWSDKLRIPYSSVSIRNQKTRWGSSSGRGHISINWRIICTPPMVQDYLIVHELLHQQLHNHSASYWLELEQVFPGAKECDRWLKQHAMIMSILRD